MSKAAHYSEDQRIEEREALMKKAEEIMSYEIHASRAHQEFLRYEQRIGEARKEAQNMKYAYVEKWGTCRGKV